LVLIAATITLHDPHGAPSALILKGVPFPGAVSWAFKYLAIGIIII